MKDNYFKLVEAMLNELMNRDIIDSYDWRITDNRRDELIVHTIDNHDITFDYDTISGEIKKITYEVNED